MRSPHYLDRFDLFFQFLQRLGTRWADAVMGGSVVGIPLFVASFFTTMPKPLLLLVFVSAFFFASYAVWREEHLKAVGPDGDLARAQVALAREQLRDLKTRRQLAADSELKKQFRKITGYGRGREDDDDDDL